MDKFEKMVTSKFQTNISEYNQKEESKGRKDGHIHILDYKMAFGQFQMLKNNSELDQDNQECNQLIRALRKNCKITEIVTKQEIYKVNSTRQEQTLLGGGHEVLAEELKKISTNGIEKSISGTEKEIKTLANKKAIETLMIIGGKKYIGLHIGQRTVKKIESDRNSLFPEFEWLAHGPGKFISNDVHYEGNFSNNLFDDLNEAKLAVGADYKYKGSFNQGEKNGLGELKICLEYDQPFNVLFEGTWKKDKPFNGIIYDYKRMKKIHLKKGKVKEFFDISIDDRGTISIENQEEKTTVRKKIFKEIKDHSKVQRKVKKNHIQSHKQRVQNSSTYSSLLESIDFLFQCVTQGCKEAKKAKNKDIVIFIDRAGSGKCSTLNFLYGYKMILATSKDLGMKGYKKLIEVLPKKHGETSYELMKISQSKQSSTLLHQVEFDEENNFAYVDCPVILNTRRAEINIANAVNVKNMIKQSNSVKFVILMNSYNLVAHHNRSLNEILNTFSDIFGNVDDLLKKRKSILIGITNLPEEIHINDFKEWLFAETNDSTNSLSENIFSFDPVGQGANGRWSREEIMNRIQSLKAIKSNKIFFKTTFSNEDEERLMEISEEIEKNIEFQFTGDNISIENFSHAAEQLLYFKQLSVLEHVGVDFLYEKNKITIERKFLECANQGQLGNSEEVVKILSLLKKLIKHFNESSIKNNLKFKNEKGERIQRSAEVLHDHIQNERIRSYRYSNGDVYEGEWNNSAIEGRGIYRFASGDIYEGEFKNNEIEGRGIYRFRNGDVYEGELKNNKKEGNDTYKYANGSVYEGDYRKSKKEGRGTYKYINGDVYKGEWKNGYKDGRGTYRDFNGNVYKGEWRNGKKEGIGKYKYANGDVYKGSFKNGAKSGRGTLLFADGSVYEGEYKNDRKEGRGKISFVEGDVYEGEWKNGKMEGNGIYRFPSGDIYEGDFKDDESEGRGIYKYANGAVYEGEYKNGKKEGRGTHRYANGAVYKGFWKKGKQEGRGTYRDLNGEVYKGDWRNGKKEGKGKYTYYNEYFYEGEFKNDKKEGKGKLKLANGCTLIGEWLNDKFRKE